MLLHNLQLVAEEKERDAWKSFDTFLYASTTGSPKAPWHAKRYLSAIFSGGGGKQNGLVRSCRKEAGDWRLRFLEDESISRHHRYGMAGPLRSSSCDSTFLVVHCELTTNNFVQCSGQGIYTNPSAWISRKNLSTRCQARQSNLICSLRNC